MRTIPSQPEAEVGMWLGFAVALAALAMVAGFARRRSRKAPKHMEEETGLRRFARLVYSAAAFASVLAAALLPEFILREGFSRRDIPMTLVGLVVFTLVGMLPFGIVHFWLGLGEPLRDRRWLIRSLLAFNLMMLACLLLIAGFGGDPLRVLNPILLPVFAAATAAALVWWAWLPPPPADVAARFE